MKFGQALVDHLVAENNELRAKLAASESFNKCRPKLDEILIPVAAQSRIAALEEALLYYAKMKAICEHDDPSWCDHCPDAGKRARAVLEGK